MNQRHARELEHDVREVTNVSDVETGHNLRSCVTVLHKDNLLLGRALESYEADSQRTPRIRPHWQQVRHEHLQRSGLFSCRRRGMALLHVA